VGKEKGNTCYRLRACSYRHRRGEICEGIRIPSHTAERARSHPHTHLIPPSPVLLPGPSNSIDERRAEETRMHNEWGRRRETHAIDCAHAAIDIGGSHTAERARSHPHTHLIPPSPVLLPGPSNSISHIPSERVRQGMKDERKKQGCTMSGEGEGKHMLSIARMPPSI
jgi:hypothetical protein